VTAGVSLTDNGRCGATASARTGFWCVPRNPAAREAANGEQRGPGRILADPRYVPVADDAAHSHHHRGEGPKRPGTGNRVSW
jgi:hypothetical protein